MEITQIALDTSVLIHYLKGREPSASAVKKAVKEFECFVTSVAVYELLFGVARAKTEIGEQTLLGIMTVIPFNDAAARKAANLHADLISRNQDIGVKDVLIAAICLENGLSLLTANQRHFSRIDGLTVITPTELIALK